MKTQIMNEQLTLFARSVGPQWRILPVLLLAMVLAVGCQRQEPMDDHAGHDHASHAGHDHAAHPKPSAAAKCAHDAPVTLCFICDPALRDKNRLWCREHARYEDRCWLCHPELEDKDREWCQEHSLYEDECYLCQPSLRGTTVTAATGAALMCGEHDVLEAECGICRPQAAGELRPGEGLKVRLPARDSAELVGIVTAVPATDTMARSIECYAELAYNQNQMAQITAPVGGILQEVAVDLGDRVNESQTVATLWSAQIAETVAKAVLAHQRLARERKLHAEGIAPAKDVEEAEAEHRTACQEARTLGFSETDIDTLGERPEDRVLLELRAPFAGEIIQRSAVRGALIEVGQTLFTVADRGTMWAMLNLPEAGLAHLKVGQTVQLEVDALPGRAFTGQLTWIAAEVDETTRLARARAEIANPEGVLRARMFARARVVIEQTQNTLVLPPSALHHVENATMVFIKLTEDLFEARRVRVGPRYNDRVAVLDGLQAGEEVVVEQGFAVKSQLLISRLGAGCAHE